MQEKPKLDKDIGFSEYAKINKKRLLLVTFSFLSIGFMLGIIINTRIFWSLGGTLWFSFSLLATVLTFIFYLIWKKASIACYALVGIVLITYLVYLELSINAAYVLYLFPVVSIIAFYLIGRVKGAIVSAVAFTITVIYLILKPDIMGEITIDLGALTNFILGSLSSMALILVYETSLVEAHGMLIQTNRALEEVAITDALTGQYNRKWIDEELEKRLEKGKKGAGFALFVVDFDDFKQINDEFGHVAGDQALKAFSNLMRGRDRVNIGRWGGEEFIVFCESSTPEAALKCADGLRRTVEENDLFQPRKISISIGVAIYELGDTSVTLIKRADKSLYKAKSQGKNRVCYIDAKDIT